jgi:hypothetical protein
MANVASARLKTTVYFMSNEGKYRLAVVKIRKEGG